VNARGHFPTEQAALKCLYLAIMSLDPTGKGRKRWTNRWVRHEVARVEWESPKEVRPMPKV
jgi:transposase-like protein